VIDDFGAHCDIITVDEHLCNISGSVHKGVDDKIKIGVCV
jgi:hypothetical protein